MTIYIRIRNINETQHYKDRSPPWIKLHRAFLTSPAWIESNDATRVLAIVLMLLASDTDNKIEYRPSYLQRMAYLSSAPDIEPLISSRFIELVDDDGNLVDLAGNVLAPASDMPQRGERAQGEGEGEEKEKVDMSAGFEEFWSVWPRSDRKQAKGKCYDVWRKGGLEAHTVRIVAHVQHLSGTDGWRKQNGAFVPAPFVYLNERRWDGAEIKPSQAHWEPGMARPGSV